MAGDAADQQEPPLQPCLQYRRCCMPASWLLLSGSAGRQLTQQVTPSERALRGRCFCGAEVYLKRSDSKPPAQHDCKVKCAAVCTDPVSQRLLYEGTKVAAARADTNSCSMKTKPAVYELRPEQCADTALLQDGCTVLAAVNNALECPRTCPLETVICYISVHAGCRRLVARSPSSLTSAPAAQHAAGAAQHPVP
jgi:hypothetical protein